MKKYLFIIFFSISFLQVSAKHIKGGFFTYQYEGPGIIHTNYLRYKISLTMYMACNPSIGEGEQLTPTVPFTIYNGSGTAVVDNQMVSYPAENLFNLNKVTNNPCIIGDVAGCYYTVVTYVLDNYELPVSADGYIISNQRCCRIDGMDNIINSENVGDTYTIAIPGTNSPVPNANENSSPVFPINDTALVCTNNYFEYSFKATDPNGDSLSYSLCNAYLGGSPDGADAQPTTASAPPYTSVPYTPPYSGSQPMGSQVSIDPSTGLLSGVAPPIGITGEYVVTVCVAEYRNGIHFADSRKELHVRVKDCTPLQAVLKPQYINCGNYSYTFSNIASNPSGTNYYWNFGDPASGTNDTSTAISPTHIFSDSGIYKINFKVTSEGGLCADSTTAIAKIYPGFFPGFEFLPPLCKGVSIQFEDTTKTKYGSVTGWDWIFGNGANTSSSLSENPKYSFQNSGTYNVEFIVANTKGCTDTLNDSITIKNDPALSVNTSNIIYCAKDSVQLTATGTGSFSWSPISYITGANTSSPIIYPPSSTKYYIKLTDANECISTDSVLAQPENNLTNSITASSMQICAEDSITLTGSANHSPVTWQWLPASLVAKPTSQTTRAFPITDTSFTLITQWGKHCIVSSSTKKIIVTPLAVPNAGADTAICYTEGAVQLNASGGTTYSWSPAEGLSNPFIANPIASPSTTTTYIVSVGVPGCTRLKSDSLLFTVRPLPPLKLTDDTLICVIDTLQLTATGSGKIMWSPDYSISSLNSFTPEVSPDVPTTYYATLTDGFGCISKDSVYVNVLSFITVITQDDTTICQTDPIILNTVSEGLQFNWSPPIYLNNPSAKSPIATPLTSETYHLTAHLGKCEAQGNVTINVVPYPRPSAGSDTALCLGASVQLHGSNADFYSWSPPTFLSSTTVSDPLVSDPTATIQYILTGTDTLGCPKPAFDTVLVMVNPDVIADAGPADTSIVLGEPLYLHATGGDIYSWSPADWLSNPTSANTIANPTSDIEYKVLVESDAGCKGSDSISVKVYKVNPDIYIPNAFTPNSDGSNDVFKPIALGIKQLNYFRVYNRWGQLVYSTSKIGDGWDGTLNGAPQNTGNYVWEIEAINYLGQLIKKQGNVLLIR